MPITVGTRKSADLNTHQTTNHHPRACGGLFLPGPPADGLEQFPVCGCYQSVGLCFRVARVARVRPAKCADVTPVLRICQRSCKPPRSTEYSVLFPLPQHGVIAN